ncbi:integrase core domain protein [Geobacillus kaustophilus]|uniref:Integrase core domain protein n=1 Tax=Geobacillus kaustophilus TaxID=1462 RepID=A0A0D8BXB5_GEOKU|nr:IS21 family transposase [Geobacillus kaustophilus]KJE28760.1 integrase core domain protein [Geobacillus kaustophilus]
MMTRGEFFMIKEMYERGMSISDIARELGIDRKTVRKYIHSPNPPSKFKRKPRKSKLDPFKPYLQKRMLEDGVFNSEKLFFEIRQQGYTGGKTILKDYMQPFRETAKKKYTVRYETLPGEQMQVDWKEVGEVVIEGRKVKLSLFVATLGYSRMKYAVFTTSQDQEHLMECLIQSFKYFGGIPKRVLFDNMKTVADGREQGVVKWNQRFSEFASYYGFIPKVCRPYRAQTKGKVERAIQYIMDHFYVGTSFESIEELNFLLHRWLDQVANRKPNATTGIPPQERWAEEQLKPLPQKDYDTSYLSYRKVHWDGSFSYKGEQWLLSAEYAGKEILVKERLNGDIRLYYRGEEISYLNQQKKVMAFAEKIKKKQTEMAATISPVSVEVDTRPLSVYDAFLRGESS